MTELPVEILAAVFLRVLERRNKSRRDQDANLSTPPDTSSLYAAMRVCRRWRDVAVCSPELWSVLPPLLPRNMADIYLKRSASVPICVFTNTIALAASPKPLYLEDPHRSRLKELCVLPTPPFWSFNVAPLPPNLVYLELQRPTTGPCTEMKLVDYPVFGGCSTVLQALSVNPRVVVPSDSFPALAHFRMPGPRWFPMPVSQLLRLLSNMPALETLYLSQTAIHDDVHEVAAPVELSRLRVLSLEPCVSTRAAAVLLSHLDLPRTLNFQLHRLQIHRGHSAAHVFVPPLDGLTTLELLENDRRLHIRARGPTTSTHDHGNSNSNDNGFWLHFISGRDGFSLREELLGPLLAKLAPMLRDVTTLRVAATTLGSGFLDFVLPHALATCPALTALVVAAPKNGSCDRDVVAAVANALSPLPPAAPDSSSGPLWTTLTSLGLQLNDSGSDLLPLADLLAQRAQHGCSVRTLTISTPRIQPSGQSQSLKNLEALRMHVDRVGVTQRVLWDVAHDMMWKAENRWWPLYPVTALDMRDGWGLDGLVD